MGADGDRGAVLVVVGVELVAEGGGPPSLPVAEIELEAVGPWGVRIGEQEGRVEDEGHVATAIHRCLPSPLIVQEAAGGEDAPFLDGTGQGPGQEARGALVGRRAEDRARHLAPRHGDVVARDRDRQRPVGAEVARGGLNEPERLDRPVVEGRVLEQPVGGLPLGLGQGRCVLVAGGQVGVAPPGEHARGHGVRAGLREQPADLVCQPGGGRRRRGHGVPPLWPGSDAR